MTEPILLERFYVKQIFGPKSHDVDLRFKAAERLTVLYGRNGGGKTIVLRLLDAIRWGRYGELLEIPFARMELHLSNGTGLILTRMAETPEPGRDAQAPSLVIQPIPKAEGADWKIVATKASEANIHLKRLRSMLDTASAGRSVLHNVQFTQKGGPSPVSDTNWSIHTNEPQMAWHLEVEPDILRNSRERLPPVTLIATDRLTTSKVEGPSEQGSDHTGAQVKPQLMVEHLSQQVQREFSDADRQYRQISARLDSSLVHRILQPKVAPRTAEALQESAASLSVLEGRLRTVGLLRDAPQPLPAHLDPNLINMIDLILTDREEKLAPFRGLVDRAEALLTSLNAKLHPKSVSLDVDKGYELRTAADTPLPLRALSSGEQQWLVMLHELLFDVKPNTLVLIDEPELSLHIEWQQTLLPELLNVAKANYLHFVLATPSPYIIGERDDLMVRVGPGPSP